MLQDFDTNDVLDANGNKPWEECFFVHNDDDDKLTSLNDLLKDGFYIYDSYPVGDAVFVRLRNSNPEAEDK